MMYFSECVKNIKLYRMIPEVDVKILRDAKEKRNNIFC